MNNKFKTALILCAFLIPELSHALEFYFEKDSSLPLVYVTAAFRGGSTQDPDGKSGLSDLMGEMMLRGTKSKTKQQLDVALDQLGGTLEFETRSEFVAFRGAVLSENLKPYLSLLEEVLTAPSFRGQELEKLKKERISQLSDQLARDRDLIKLRFEQTLFQNHPYGRPGAGKIKDIKNISANDLQNQYQKLISESTLVLLGAGDTQESDFDGFLKEIKAKRNQVSHLTVLTDFKGLSKTRVVIFDKPDRTQTQVAIGQKGINMHTPNLDALQLANHAFGGGSFQARLMVELRVKRGWTYGAGSVFKLGSKDHSWRVAFFPKNADTPPAVKEALQLISDLKKSGITESEFSEAKQSLVNSAGFTFNTPKKRLENRLVEVLYGLPNGYFKDYANRINALTLDQVNQAIEKFVTPDQLLISLVATAKTTKSDLAKALGIPESSIEVQDYQKE